MGARFDRPAEFPQEARAAILGAALTLTFDTRLHLLDATALNAFIADLLGPATDVAIEEGSDFNSAGPSLIRINGANRDDLVRVAEAFYDRVWRSVEAVVEARAHQNAMSSGVALILGRLDEMRARLVRLDAPPMFPARDGAEIALAGHAVEDRFAALARAVAEEARLRHDPPDAATFVARLEEDVHTAVRELESQRRHLAGEGEESLRSRLVTYLRGKDYEATAETDEGGHVDILVRSAKLGLLWVGECKVHGAYEELDEGMLQLHTRYASGRYPAVGFIIFCFNQDAGSVVAAWKARLIESKLCGLLGDPVEDPRHALCFTTRHQHAGAGLEVVTRHVVASLYWGPEDKSGRTSRGSRRT